ncbi:MAG: cache domain-containing protein [Candidatus Cloacimonetes bacterium]|nr:cache domain-containing protein [Candidatus Cloacimonadota bacterium]
MKKKTCILTFSIFFLLIFIFSCTTPSSQYDYKKTEDLVSFVSRAVDLIEKQGEEAFPQFRIKDSEWNYGDLYIFVWGLDGMRYVYPPDISGEGKNMLALKDINGKPIGKLFVEAISGKTGEGWVHYQWPKPNSEIPIWKSTFLKKAVAPSGKAYLVGSGLYEMPVDKAFVVYNVNQAVELLAEKGKDAFADLRSTTSPYRFMNCYIFVKDMKGNELFNAAFPELEGTNILELKDVDGQLFVKKELEILENKDQYWNEYMWPKPGQEEPSLKRVFVKKALVDGEILVVGCGYYPSK